MDWCKDLVAALVGRALAARRIYLEEHARGQIGQEALHTMATTQTLRDYDH